MERLAQYNRPDPALALPPRQPPRQRFLAWTAIILVTALSWLYLLYLDANMQGGMATEMGGMVMPRPWTWLDAWLMFLMWAVMMVAMMLPGASPMILLYQRIAYQKMRRPQLSVALFVTGYLLVWTAFSAAATGAQWALREIGLVNDMMVSSSALLSGTLLVTAGAYQLSPWKQTCLKHCQAPFAFIMQHWRSGQKGALVMGLHHGAYCLGCCWLVMALLFVGGVMNLLWIALLALIVLMEKILPGIWPARVLGVTLIVAGTWLLLGRA
ncbi:MAG: DUF2182 domain-containing protein [Halioglobus sp.]